MFQPPRDRDAHASIRGYVYQVDRTVDRWLGLGVEQVLELERGEDIDLVGRLTLAAKAGSTEHRLLEQVKYRDTSVTLRTPSALEALANFHDHRVTNPGLDVRFCFLTNALVGSEQLNPFPDRIPGIALWEKIRTLQLDLPDATVAADGLRRFLAQLPRPERLAENVWTAWNEYLTAATPDRFREFIERFEWSTGNLDAIQLPVALRSRIIAVGLATDEVEAGAIADRLFVYVARLLSTAGLKRLTLKDRTEVAAAPALSAEDHKLLTQLRAVVTEHSGRIQQLEENVATLGNRLETVVLARTTAERVDLALPPLELSLPLPVTRLSGRRKTAEDLCRILAMSSWLAIHGGPDTGKSQLSVQLALTNGRCRGWVRFHHAMSTTEAAARLEDALAELAGCSQVSHRTGWYAAAFDTLGTGALIVLDDLPRMPSDDAIAERFLRFGEAARAAGVTILSTSQFELPSRLRNHLSGWLQDRPVPTFTDAEAEELFRSHGAPDTFLSESRLRFLNGHATGHPLLLTATAEFLATREWRYSEEDIVALLRGDHTQAILPEVVDRLTRSLVDQSRELLYRLTLAIGSFDQADWIALAGVSPPVDRPRERLNDLLGAWVQRDTDTRFAVSPLTKPLGRSELAVEVRKRCCRELADVITRRGVMNLPQGHRAILYNMEAGEAGRAVTLFVLFLVEVVKASRADHLVPLLSLWKENALPRELTVGNRLFVRAYQLRALTTYGIDASFIVRDIDNLLDQATDADGWGIVTLAVQNLGQFRSQDPTRVLRYIKRAIELPVVLGPEGRDIKFDVFLPDMLWMLVTDLSTMSLLCQWFDVVEAIPERHLAQFWDSDTGGQAVWLVANKMYSVEWEKPAPEQDWNRLLRDLRALLNRSHQFRQPRVEAGITGLTLEILGDRKMLADAPALAEATLTKWPKDADVQFKLHGTLGRLYAYGKRTEDALAHLNIALSQPHSQLDHEELRCLLAATICVGANDLSFGQKARDLARVSDNVPDLEAVRALGEFAISKFQVTGGQAGAMAAFSTWSEAMRRFFAARWKDRIWRDFFALLAHATSYLAGMARFGRPPEKTADGSPFLAPARGFLLKDYMPEREAMYWEGGEASLALMMGLYAVAAGAGDESTHWMKVSIEESRKVGASFIQIASGDAAIAELLVAGQFEDAIETGLLVGRGRLVHSTMGPTDRFTFEGRGIDLTAEFRKLTEQQRRLGDVFALIAGAVPAALVVVRLSLADIPAAIDAAKRVIALCRQLADDEWGDRELWQLAADMVGLVSQSCMNTRSIMARIDSIQGTDERATALRVLGYLLATWPANLDEALRNQLSVIEVLLRWFPVGESIHRRILTPYVEAYWRHAAQERRFLLRAPDFTVGQIEEAMIAPETDRLRAVLSAAANGFRIGGAHGVLQKLHTKALQSQK